MSLLRFDPNARISAEQALQHEYFSDIRNMNPDIERFKEHTTKILDFSLGNNPKQIEGKTNTNPGIEHYRMLIEELEKFAERSTNRSGNGFFHPHKQQQRSENVDISRDFDQSMSSH